MRLNPFRKHIDTKRSRVGAPRALSEVRPGALARVARFGNISPAWQERLLAHGILPGCVVRVLQHQPVTIIQVEHMELGFERSLARMIEVDAL